MKIVIPLKELLRTGFSSTKILIVLAFTLTLICLIKITFWGININIGAQKRSIPIDAYIDGSINTDVSGNINTY